MDWYTLRVISGKEKKIKDTILFELNTANLNESVENILVPTENVLEMNKETKYVIENVNGVISFVGSNGNPDSLKPDEVKRFLGDHDGADGPIKITEAAPFKVGDSVNVKDGPFVDFSGIVQEVNHEKQKLKVSVSIFGRSTPVELDYLQVALEN